MTHAPITPIPAPPASETTPKKEAAVLELLASRICHDLISPVGAINNGIEFIQEMGADSLDEGLSLIAHSASQASAKLGAFRIAYGAGGRDGNLKPEDVQKAFSQLVGADGKIAQIWDPYGPLGPPKPYPYAYCKMLMGTMMLAMECLVKGGTIAVRPGTGAQTIIIAEGSDLLIRENVEAALTRTLPAEDLDPRLVHPFAISVIADHYGYKISIAEKSQQRVVYALDCPAPTSVGAA